MDLSLGGPTGAGALEDANRLQVLINCFSFNVIGVMGDVVEGKEN